MSAIHNEFEAVMNSGAPIVDNASTRLYAIGELEPDSDDAAGTSCTGCDGDGCDWHLSPTNGAIEIDRACPTCEGTGRTPR